MLKVEPNFTEKKLLKLPKNLIFINGVTYGSNVVKVPFSFKEFQDLCRTLRALH